MSIIKKGILLFVILLSGCVSLPPADVNNICSVFRQYPQWYKDAIDVQKRWRMPIPVQMAIIHQESKFNARAQPPRRKLLWIIPWKRPSTAYGYTQALRGTWAHYKKTNGNLFTARDHFGDGVDFIGWYANMAYRQAGIPRDDAYGQYLAYHEGIGGYQHKSYLKKPWLIVVARKVKARSNTYQAQLASCHKSLPARNWYKMW